MTKKRQASEQRVPPQNMEAEAALLGCCLMSDAAIDQAAEIVDAAMFYSDVNAIVFRALQSMRSQGLPVDAVTLANFLNAKGQFDDMGGTHRITELLGAAPYIAHAPEYAKPIRDCYRRRLAESAGQKLIELAHDMTTPPDDALAAAESVVQEAIAGGGAKGLKPAADVLVGVLDAIDNPMPERIIPTGFSSIDALIRGGMRGGNQIILAARPSVGKTALALAIARNILETQAGVLFVSYEMTAAEIVERLIAIVSAIPMDDFRRMRNSVQDAARQIDRLPLYVDDSQPNINQLCATIRIASRKGVRLVVADYLQLIPPEDSRAMRETQVASVSRKLKQVALSCGVTVLALSQLNRQVENRDNPRPRLSDLRESGAIEQDADIVGMLWRPNKDGGPDKGADNVACVDLAKNRNGRCGQIELAWHGPTATFAEVDQWEATR